jgi:hypothetical protein
MTASDDDRIAYLAGDTVESLTPGERAELDELRALLRAAPAWAEPDPSLEDRVVDAIAHEARTGPPKARVRRRAFPARLRLRRPAFALAGLAALAAAAIIVFVVANNTSRAPEQLAMVVSGTPLAPGAHGSATLTKTSSGWQIHLSATGLPHLSGTTYYQAWLKNSNGILVPVGTFNDARNVTLWSGVPATQYRTLTVTVQRANGNPASSGRRVLTGTARAKR